MWTTPIADIARTLKGARVARRMSQNELGARVGVPQSHISKIESGAVDLKLSSLIELARALELELVLVPRQMLNVVEGLQRGARDDEQYSRLEIDVTNELENLGASIRQLRQRLDRGGIGDMDELEKLDRAISGLVHLFVPKQYAREVRQILTMLKAPVNVLQNLRDLQSDVGHAANYPSLIKKQFEIIRPLRMRLQDIRNAAAHGAHEQASPQIPAYRLDEEDDDA